MRPPPRGRSEPLPRAATAARDSVGRAVFLHRRRASRNKAGGFSRVVEGQDVWVREARRDFDLAEEPLRTERGSELGLQHLDGDLAMVLQVLGEIDRRHPAAAQLSLDQVTVGECRLERREHVRHAAARSWVWLNHRTRPESGPAPTRYN